MTDDENPVEIRTALALAKLWDDPKNNHFDCPWHWRKTMKEHWKHDLPDTPSRTSRLIKKHGVEGAEIILDEEEREEVEEEKERGDAEADEG